MSGLGDLPPHQLRCSARARRLRIDVSCAHGVVVVVPRGTPRPVIERFVRAHSDWIQRARERVGARSDGGAARPDAPVPARLDLPALGRSHPVEHRGHGARRVQHTRSGLVVSGAADAADARALLVAWLKRLGRRELVPWLERLAREAGLTYARAAVRGQRSRWGSCSGRGTISLNYKLLFLEPALVEHVMLHELAHTRHLNHSHAFWRLLARLDPHGRAHHAALQHAGAQVPAWTECD